MRWIWKRHIALVLALCLLLGTVCLSAGAASSETDNFLGGYTLTGCGATDMVAVALAQEGRTGRDFGYDDQWCAYFVSDCARICGETAAIPPHGTCTYLYQNLLNAGGSVTTDDPKPGDICFINWSGGTAMRHVEIVYRVEDGMVYTVGGNSGSGSSYLTRLVKCHAPLDWEYVVAIVRPAYGMDAPETEPTQPKPAEPAPTEPEPVVEYSITFDAAGGTGAPEPQTKRHGETIQLSTQIPRREGYTFLGWFRDGCKRYEPGCWFNRNKDTHLYAKWVKINAGRQLPGRPAAIGCRIPLLERPCDAYKIIPQAAVMNFF